VTNLIGKVFGEMANESADKTLAINSMFAAAAGAQAYFAAALQSVTPEVRALLSGFATQKALEHEAMNTYLMQKGWIKPYEEPIQQLMMSEQQAEEVISKQ